MPICLSVSLLAQLHKYHWLELHEKKPEEIGLASNLDPIKF